MEIYDVVIDSMEAIDYQTGKALHLSKPEPQVLIVFKLLACIGAVFSLVKITFILVYYRKAIHKKRRKRKPIGL